MNSNSDNIVVFLCEELNQSEFFFHMEKGFFQLGYKVIYLVLNLSVYIDLSKKTNAKVILIKKKKYKIDTTTALQSKEYIESTLNKNNVKKIYESVFYFCNKVNKETPITLFICSQGVKVAEMAVKNYAKMNNIKVLFCELANISGKTFWDKNGSNAISYLYNHIELLDEYKIDENSYNEWKKLYLQENFKKHIVKQAAKVKKSRWIYSIIARFGFLYTGLKIQQIDILKKLVNYIETKKLTIEFDKVDLENTKYIFFPMQVASDSQIILNSDVSLIEALQYSINKAKSLNMTLIIKLHPAERDVSVVKNILSLRKKYNFKIVNDNTFVVIKNAFKIITINSTVALEAMIIGKEVEILGRSYYKFFNEERIKKYIMCHLLPIDYFSKKDFAKEQIKNLINKSW